MGEYALGQSVWRFEDQRLLRGGGRYVDDMNFPGQLYGALLRSPHAHAKILSIDTKAAKAAPGVRCVITGEDWEASGYGELPKPPDARKRADGSPMYRPYYIPLSVGRVRHVGDPVAFVAADTKEQAMDACELIEVDYEMLPAVVSTADAAADDAPLVWDDCPNNISFNASVGDREAAEAAVARADHVIRHRFVINRVYAAAMEPRGSIGLYDRADDHYTVYTTLQRPHGFRGQLAKTLKIPESRLRVVAGDVGGSFGAKSAVFNEVPLVLLASKLTGRPVKWTATRSEGFIADAHGRDLVSEVALGLDKDGRFLGMTVKNQVALGAYIQQAGDGAATGNLGTLAGVYTTPAIHVDVTGVLTNTNPMRPYRGNGRPEACYIMERMVDLAADELGVDPVELRRRNMISPEAMPFKTGLTFTYDCGEFEKGMDMALEMADLPGLEARREDARKRGKLLGWGISMPIERAASPGIEGAEVRFDKSGSVTLVTGALSQGQGHETVFKQLLCDRLGLDPKDVHYVQGDTDKVAIGEGTGGSRTATTGGGAVWSATNKIEAKAKKIAAKVLEVLEDEIIFDEGVFSSPKSNRSLTVTDVAKLSHSPDNLPDGMEPGLVESAVFQNTSVNYPNGCHICELEIDEETGAVQLTRYNVVDDVGTMMNPLLLHGQVHGGIAQGVGQALMEDIIFDAETGQTLTGSFMDYAMPHASDLSAIHVKGNPVPTKTNPLGVKGAGEAGNVGGLPAVCNALVDALSIYGIRHIEMPATAERIWRVINAAKSAQAVE